jgi:hypothetical protein
MLCPLTGFSALDYVTPRSRSLPATDLCMVTGVMKRTYRTFGVVSAIVFIGMAAGCQTSGVGDPCTPEDEYEEGFSGFSVDEVNVESRSFQCETRLCLVNHFQGRVSCPYGNNKSSININKGQNPPECHIPGSTDVITAPVDPQIQPRQANDSVYCSCRCAGPDQNARYCDCPSGFACVKLVDKLPLGGSQLAGSYCIRENTTYVKGGVDVTNTCKITDMNCGPITANGEPEQ